MKNPLKGLWLSILFTILGICAVQSQQLELFRSNGKIGCRYTSGEVILEPIYDQIGKFNDDLLWLQQHSDDQAIFGLADLKGTIVAPVQYTTIQVFNQNMLYTQKYVDGQRKFGLLLSKTGKELLSAEYDSIVQVEYPFFHIYKKGKIGVLNNDGTVPLPAIYDDFRKIDCTDSYSCWYQVAMEGKFGLMDPDHNLVVPPEYDSVGRLDGLIHAQKGNLHGVFSEQGEEIIPVKYGNPIRFNNGVSPIKVQGKYGYIDTMGRVVCEPKFEKAEFFPTEKLAAVQLNGKWGFIDPNFKMVIPNKYDDTSFFIEGLCAVSKRGKWGYIDIKGKTVFPFKFVYAGPFVAGSAIVRDKNGNRFYMDHKGNLRK